MSIITWDRLVESPTSEKVFLAEIKPGELLLGWTLTGGQTHTYEISYLNETITRNDDTTEIFRKEIIELKENGTALTEQSSIATVEANSGSWWHDTANAKLYVHSSGDDSPVNYTLIGYFWMRLGTKGIMLEKEGVEINSSANAASDPNGNEADATTGWGSNYDTFESSSVDKTTGSYSIHVVRTSTGSYAIGGSADDVVIGAIYKVTLDIKVVSGTPTLRAEHGPVWGDILDTNINTGGEWASKIYYFTCPPLGDIIRVGFRYSSNFEAYIDNMSIKRVTRHYYEPYIKDKGVPALKLGNPDVYWGVTQISGGELDLLNNTGFFDQISKRWLWINKQCRLLMGGEDLPYSEYKLLRTHIIVDKDWTKTDFKLELRPKAHDFFRKVPTEVFTIGVYSAMESGLEGEVIPILYGDFGSREASPAYCICQSLGSDQYLMKSAGHAVHSFRQAYIDYGGEEGWQILTIDSSSLSNATWIFTSGSYKPGTTDVKMSLVGVASGTGFLLVAPHIMEHFLTTYCGVETSDISSYHLSTSLTRTEASLAIPIVEEVDAIEVIDKICRSDLAFFDEDETGKFRYRTWQPYLATSFTPLNNRNLLKYSVKDETEQLFWQVKVGYRHDPIEDEYLYVTNVYSASKFMYDQAETLVHDTYISDKTDAERLAQRLLFLMRDPSPQGKFDLPNVVMDKLLGDQVKITLARSPFGTAGGWVDRRFELSRLDLSFFPVKTKAQAFDLKEFGGGVGFWTGTVDVTSWGGATEEQRLACGFWCDTLGYADPNDSESLNASIWW